METKEEYQKYQASVESFLKRNNVKAGCYSQSTLNGEPLTEEFSSWPCECCSRRLAGAREQYKFACENKSYFEANICLDCVYYLAYGQLDDMTMINIKD